MNKTQIYNSNLCNEIMMTAQEQLCTLGVYYAPYIPNMNKPKYQFSRARWYSSEMHGQATWRFSDEYNSVISWCTERFGPHPTNQDAWSRWWVGLGVINFRDEQDYQWFILRWGT